MQAPNKTFEPMLVTVRDACQALGCGATSIYRLVRAGRLKPVKIGRATRFNVEDVRAIARGER
ncbi:helix-turn-helix domain-containing protein [Chelatococcus sp. XZ-Ab1]|uniref:helix-turn-helix domain-containing protein n=1 Tax=Chelatococcus sp. XZ-Ab1 TaxID=3034027 RepID=UPI0023E35D7D|nr:helix-turn-helix domain-containing protein [Chelatococcus sp. XZ-Ab1]